MKKYGSIFLLFVFMFSYYQEMKKPAKSNYVQEHYTKKEMYITMRDGVKLFTSIYTPKDISKNKKYPILMQRTCYSVAPYGENEFKTALGPNKYLMNDEDIFVYQDVRGR